jgi:phage tail protein X
VSGTYTTVQGDKWDRIAHTQLGDVGYTDKLMSANQEYIQYFYFPAGIVLKLPDIDVPLPTALPPWKRVNG